MASLVLFLEDGTSLSHVLDPEIQATLGRHPDNLLPFSCESVSSHHAVLTSQADGWYVQDLGSSNGTRINGAPVEEALVSDGDRLGFGQIQAIFYLDDAAAAAMAASDAATPARVAPPVPALRRPESPIPLAPPIKRQLPADRLRQVSKNYPGEDTSGCMNALFLTGLCLASVLLGLWLHHLNATGRNFISDAFGSIFDKVPRITIEKKVDSTEK